jgi:hypothetical protein
MEIEFLAIYFKVLKDEMMKCLSFGYAVNAKWSQSSDRGNSVEDSV